MHLLQGQLRRRIKNPLFARVPHPLPRFTIEIYDTAFDFITCYDTIGPLVHKRQATIQEIDELIGRGCDWILEQGLGRVISEHIKEVDCWIKVSAYPAYIKPAEETNAA